MGGANSKKRAKRLAEVQERYATESSNIGQGVTTLNKYERHAILGEGTFGRVILYNIDGNPVAVILKILTGARPRTALQRVQLQKCGR